MGRIDELGTPCDCVRTSADKPPLGLKPQYIADTQRAREILAAVDRYLEAGTAIPDEWVMELQERVKSAVTRPQAESASSQCLHDWEFMGARKIGTYWCVKCNEFQMKKID